MTLDQELRAVLAERAEAWETPPPDFNAFIAGGRARQHRHRRVVLSASAVAVAGALAVGIVLGRGLWDTRSTPNPADQPSPTTSLRTDDRVGPPLPGTPPTGPATGELVAAATNYTSGSWVYADGRLINVLRNRPASDAEFTGYAVRYLTPSGVEAMRSYLLDRTPKLNPPDDHNNTELLVRDGGRLMTAQPFAACGKALLEDYPAQSDDARQVCPPFEHPEDWLPDSAWEDPAYRPFVPHSYAVALVADEHSPAEALLPVEAVDILMASPDGDSTGEENSWVLANSVARELADIMDQAGPDYARSNVAASLAYTLPSVDGALIFEPVLPHGETFCSACG